MPYSSKDRVIEKHYGWSKPVTLSEVYLFHDAHGWTFQRIADFAGLTEERARQLYHMYHKRGDLPVQRAKRSVDYK